MTFDLTDPRFAALVDSAAALYAVDDYATLTEVDGWVDVAALEAGARAVRADGWDEPAGAE